MLRLGIWLSCNLLLHALAAQQQIAISDYMVAQPGDTLIFERSSGGNITEDTAVYQQTSIRNQNVLKIAELQGFTRCEKLSEKGLEVFLFTAANGRERLPEKPLHCLPKHTTIRQTYRDSSQYREILNGVSQGGGTIIVETQVEGFMSAETPLRNFVDCLIINTTIALQKNNGTREIIEYKEWYAKGIGLVNAISRTHHMDTKGKSSPLQIVMIQLKKATVGGKVITGRAR